MPEKQNVSAPSNLLDISRFNNVSEYLQALKDANSEKYESEYRKYFPDGNDI